MSETEMHKGTLKATDETVDGLMKDREFPEYFDKNNPKDVLELFNDIFRKNKILLNGIVYNIDIDMSNLDDDADIYDATILENGDIGFTLRYYNGGCGFEEAMEIAIKNARK